MVKRKYVIDSDDDDDDELHNLRNGKNKKETRRHVEEIDSSDSDSVCEIPNPAKTAIEPDSYRTCSLGQCNEVISEANDGYVRIRVGKDNIEKMKELQSHDLFINFDAKFMAELHTRCWAALQKRGAPKLVRAVVREAKEYAEFFDARNDWVVKAKETAKLLKNSSHAVVFTGAGISTSAGIGDYRGLSGKWTEQDMVLDGAESEDEGVDYESLRPTLTHEAITKLHSLGIVKYVISQNADDLHMLSGLPMSAISEVHGNVYLERCSKCDYRERQPFYVPDDHADLYYSAVADGEKPTIRRPKYTKECPTCKLNHFVNRKCSRCGGQLMDTIINFGDNLEESILDRATENATQCDVMLSLGTTMSVTPVCELGEKCDKLIICNRQKTQFDNSKHVAIRLSSDCDNVMEVVMREILGASYEGWFASLAGKQDEYDRQRPGSMEDN
eukprot:Rmarinus@m.8334